MDTTLELEQLPDWLLPTELPKFPITKEHRQLEQIVFASLFERVIEGVTEGRSAKAIVEDDPRDITFGRFYQWIRRDPERIKRYEEAQEASAEVMMEDAQQIADGDPNQPPEDVQRSNLRIQWRKFRIQAYNRKRYGDKQVVDVTNTTTISIKNLLEKRDQKLAQHTIEGEFSHAD